MNRPNALPGNTTTPRPRNTPCYIHTNPQVGKFGEHLWGISPSVIMRGDYAT